MHVTESLLSVYPLLQPHSYDPTVFTQTWPHRKFPDSHSFRSAHKERQVNKLWHRLYYFT